MSLWSVCVCMCVFCWSMWPYIRVLVRHKLGLCIKTLLTSKVKKKIKTKRYHGPYKYMRIVLNNSNYRRRVTVGLMYMNKTTCPPIVNKCQLACLIATSRDDDNDNNREWEKQIKLMQYSLDIKTLHKYNTLQ